MADLNYNNLDSEIDSLNAGSSLFNSFETELVSRRPSSTEEELDACRRQLSVAREKLKAANEQLKGTLYVFKLK